MLYKLNEGRKEEREKALTHSALPVDTVSLSTFLVPYGRPARSLVVFVRRIRAAIVPQCVFVIDRVISSFGIIRSLLIPRHIPRRSNLVL